MSYSLSEARKEAESLSEMPPEPAPEMPPETPLEESSIDECSSLEDGEIREPPVCLPTNLSVDSSGTTQTRITRSLVATNDKNQSVTLSTYEENGERKMYVYTDQPMTLSVEEFYNYVSEMARSDYDSYEKKRDEEFDEVAKGTCLATLLLMTVFFLWIHYLMIGHSQITAHNRQYL